MIGTYNNYGYLSKAGKIILALTLIFSILFIAIGISNLIEDDSDYEADDYNETKTPITVYANSQQTFYKPMGYYYELEFRPSSSGTYVINLNGARVSGISYSGSSSVSYSYTYDSSYDNAYTAYLTSGYTYTITIYASESPFEFYTYRNYN